MFKFPEPLLRETASNVLLKGKPLYDFMYEFPILQAKNKDPACLVAPGNIAWSSPVKG